MATSCGDMMRTEGETEMQVSWRRTSSLVAISIWHSGSSLRLSQEEERKDNLDVGWTLMSVIADTHERINP